VTRAPDMAARAQSRVLAAQVLWQVGDNVETWNRSTHRAALGLPDLTRGGHVTER
jgi:hypothetical protein